jgi:hypothetical protein
MSTWSTAGRHALFLSVSIFFGTLDAYAQIKVSDIALKSGESAEMGITYWITRGANCRSTLEKIEGVEVSKAPPNSRSRLRKKWYYQMVAPRKCRAAELLYPLRM